MGVWSITKDDIRDEKDCAGDVVLVSRETEVFIHALDFRIADVPSVNMGQQIKKAHNGNQPVINLHIAKYKH